MKNHYHPSNGHRHSQSGGYDRKPNPNSFQAAPLSKKQQTLKDLKVNAVEEGAFAIYLNHAVSNIATLSGIGDNVFEEDRIRQLLSNLPEKQMNSLIDFIWLFASNEPDLEFPDKKPNLWSRKECAIELIVKIYSLRNYFSHGAPPDDGKKALTFDYKIYVMLSGLLFPKARQAALLPGMDAEKIGEIQLFENEKPEQARKITRTGLIFLCSMFLYRDDAHEFCRLFRGLNSSDLYGRAFTELFTFYSYRRSRQSLDAADWNFMNFADILGYLNTAPEVSMEFLSLKEEREQMRDRLEDSKETDDNKKRFTILPRKRQKFASYALGYLEDFKLLPSLRFKKIDVSDNPGRTRFTFESQEANRLNRHFAIDRDNIHYSFLPERHYGNITIGELRGTISHAELKRIIFTIMGISKTPEKTAAELDNYFKEYLCAYHKLLERLLNISSEAELNEIDWHDYSEELCTIAGAYREELAADLYNLLTPFIGASIAGIFAGKSQTGKPPREILLNRLSSIINGTRLLEDRIRREKISDGIKIAAIFRLFNYHLEKNEKFRQLPVAQQHNGPQDFEYQTVHELLGKYTTNPKKIWRHFDPKYQEEREMHRSGLLKKLSFLKRAASLDELALIAVREYRKISQNMAEDIQNGRVPVDDALCRKFGVKSPLKEISLSNVIKSILKISLDDWKNAYDYEHGGKYQDRALDSVEHIVPQVSIPNGLVLRMIRLLPGIKHKPGWLEDKNTFDFNIAMAKLEPPVPLRDFYDVSILLDWLKENAALPRNPVNNAKKNQIDKAIRAIKEFRNQDKLLSLIAWKYRSGYSVPSDISFDEPSVATVYGYYEEPIRVKTSCKGRANFSIIAHANDLNKPSFLTVRAAVAELADAIDPLQQRSEMSYFELMLKLREIQAADRKIRKSSIVDILRLDEKLGTEPELSGTNQEKRRQFCSWIHSKVPGISPDAADKIIEFRNAIFHDRLHLARHFDVETIMAPIKPISVAHRSFKR